MEEFKDWKIPSWGIRHINSGFDGSTSQDWLDKVQTQVINYNPDLVIVMGTSNDSLLKITPQQHSENIRKLLDELEKAVDNIVFCTDIVGGKDELNQTYEPYFEELVKVFPHNKVHFLNLYKELEKYDVSKFFTLINNFGNPANNLKPGEIDFVHPNVLGNAYIAKIILEQVFGIDFNPEKYLEDLSKSIMFPRY